MRRICVTGLLCLASCFVRGGDSARADSHVDAPGPAQIAAAGDLTTKSTVADVLDALHDSGVNLKSFSADLSKKDEDFIQATDATHLGKFFVQFKPDGNPILRITFNHDIIGKHDNTENTEYVLDDGWVTHRDYQKKKEDRTQMTPPGQKVNLFQLGEGQFPLPIGQKKDDVNAQFKVTRADPDKDDPAGTIHLVLVPRPGTRMAEGYKVIEVWVDEKLKMPVRIYTGNKQDTAGTTVNLTNMKINVPLKPQDITFTPLPAGTGWDSVSRPMQGAKP